jgi:KipI family sensor histidine kinase inhibitor
MESRYRNDISRADCPAIMKQPEITIPRIVPLSESALTIEFGETIDPRTNESVLAFATAVEQAGLPGFLEVVPTYRSATVYFDPFRTDVSTMTGHFRALMTATNRPPLRAPTTHTIPVWYGGSAGPDLIDVAKRATLPPEQVTALHASVVYRVYMLGFSPGFPYLGTVPDRIATPRLPTPRKQVAAGSVGIAGTQTGIYPACRSGRLAHHRTHSGTAVQPDPTWTVLTGTGRPGAIRADRGNRIPRAVRESQMNQERSIDLNCDLGEAATPEQLDVEARIMAYVTSVNIACGVHAGDAAVMRSTVQLARQHDLAIGAHPGLPDRDSGGRREQPLSRSFVQDLILAQVGELMAISQAEGLRLSHVKPHGGALQHVGSRPPRWPTPSPKRLHTLIPD